MFGACHVTSPAFIVCEDATHGNLATFLTEYGQDSMWGLLHEAALGLEYLHRNRVVHGDLKLNNLLVGSNGATLVADFGLSFVNDSSASSNIQDRGGLRWLAPECLTGRPTFESDVFSLAMCIVEAVQGEPPFAYIGDDTVIQNLRDGKLPARPAEMPDDAWDLVVSMAALDPSERPPLSAVISSLEHLKMTRDKSASQTIVLQKPKPSQGLGEGSDVFELVASLKSDSASIRYTALKWLYRKTEDIAGTHLIKQADGYRWLARCFSLPQATWDQQVYAFGCIRRMRITSALTVAKIDGITLTAPTEAELAAMLEVISAPEREEELVVEVLEKIYLIETWDDLMKHSFVPPLMKLVHDGTERQVALAARAVASLIKQTRDATVITATEALPLLLNQFEVCSGQRKEAAARLLAKLSAYIGITSLPGVLEYLVGQIRAPATERAKVDAVDAIASIATNPANLDLMTDNRVYEPLMELIRNGSVTLQCAAVTALYQCMAAEATKRAIVEDGAIPHLVELARSGSERARPIAAVALGALACGSESRSRAITDMGVIPIVVDLIRKGDDATKSMAIMALSTLAHNTSSTVSIIAAGALLPIIELVRGGTDEQKDGAASALANLANSNDASKRAIRAAGGIPPLVALLRDGNERQKCSSAWALENLVDNDDNARAMVAAGAIQVLTELAQSGNDTLVALAATIVCMIGKVNGTAVSVPTDFAAIVGRLRSKDREQRQLAATALSKLAFLSASNRQSIVSAGAIAALVELLHVGAGIEQGYALRSLYHLTQNSTTDCRSVVDCGAITPLVKLLRDGNELVSGIAADVFATIAWIDSHAYKILQEEDALPALAFVLNTGSIDQRRSTARALSRLVLGSDDVRRLVLDALLDQGQRGTDQAKENAVAALASIASSTPITCRRLADAATLPFFVQLTAGETGPKTKHAIVVLRCLAETGFREDIECAGGAVALVRILETGTAELKNEAALALGALARRSPESRAELVKLQVISPLVEMARLGDDDQKTNAAFALGSLMKTKAAQREVKQLGGLDALRSLAKNGTPAQAKAARRAISIGGSCHVS